METLDSLIDESKDVRELKRALSIKMLQAGLKPQKIAEILNVSEQYVSKWKGIHHKAGPEGLQLGHQGSQAYLTTAQKAGVIEWIKDQESISVEALRDYIEAEHGVIYLSKQSYYELLKEGGLSYHRSTAVNPKRDEVQILDKREAIKKKWRNTNQK